VAFHSDEENQIGKVVFSRILAQRNTLPEEHGYGTESASLAACKRPACTSAGAPQAWGARLVDDRTLSSMDRASATSSFGNGARPQLSGARQWATSVPPNVQCHTNLLEDATAGHNEIVPCIQPENSLETFALPLVDTEEPGRPNVAVGREAQTGFPVTGPQSTRSLSLDACLVRPFFGKESSEVFGNGHTQAASSAIRVPHFTPEQMASAGALQASRQQHSCTSPVHLFSSEQVCLAFPFLRFAGDGTCALHCGPFIQIIIYAQCFLNSIHSEMSVCQG
jgi:hypothetical protein